MTGRTYILKHAYSFWEWDEEEGVIAFRDGQTISYEAPLANMIQELAPQRLPRFGSLLLVLLALNSPFEYGCKKALAGIRSGDADFQNIKKDAYAFLKELSELPASLRAVDLRTEVMKVVFQKGHGLMSYKLSAKIAEIFSGYGTRLLPTAQQKTYAKEEKEDLRVLALLNRYFTRVGGIRQNLSQLKTIPEPIELEEQVGDKREEAPRELVDLLIENRSTSTIGQLIRPIWAGLSIPYRGIEPSQQPTGGVSDLTNKGNLDKLLLSEYANDDLMFLARLANHEALYLNRESPPVSNTRKRVMLIDVSLKNWGRPKTLSMAIAIAIGTHPKTVIEQEAYAVGGACTPISLSRLEEVMAALKEVEATLDASEGIREYFSTTPEIRHREVFVLTEKSTLHESGMQQVMSEFREEIDYTIALDAKGTVDVYRRAGKNTRHLQHMELRVKKILSPTNSPDQHLMKSYPVLVLPRISNSNVFFTEERDVFCVTKEKTLLQLHYGHWGKDKSNWCVICENLPWGKGEFAAATNQRGELVILAINPGIQKIWLLNLFTQQSVLRSCPEFNTSQTRPISYEVETDSFIRTNSHLWWRIDQQGKVSRIDDAEDVKAVLIKLKEAKPPLDVINAFKATNVFKNLKSVRINERSGLMLNSHQLLLNSHGVLKLEFSRSRTGIAFADNQGDGCFQFGDGSMVQINRSGLIVLSSSDPELPDIYCPSILDKSLGIGNEKAFAGNRSYYNFPLYQLRVLDFGPRKVEVLAAGKVPSNERKDIPAPRILMSTWDHQKAILIKDQMESLGATIELIPVSNTLGHQEVISTQQFYERYIGRFIQVILDHETHN